PGRAGRGLRPRPLLRGFPGQGRDGVTGAFQAVRALVVGFGVSGRAAAQALLEEGAIVRVSEARPFDVLVSEADEGTGALLDRIELLAGGHARGHLDGIDLLVASPGVPERAPIL